MSAISSSPQSDQSNEEPAKTKTIHIGEYEGERYDLPLVDPGVAKIRNLFRVFGKGWSLVAMWTSIYSIAFAFSLASATTGSYLQIATSTYSEHALLGTIVIVNAIVTAARQPFVAKALDLGSRPAGHAVGITFIVLGYIVVATSKSVETVAGGQVITTVGSTFLNLAQAVLVSDLTSLRYRALLQSCMSIPWLINAFVAGFITEGISAYTTDGWRWGYGMFCIILPIVSAPAIGVLFWGDRRAKQHVHSTPVSPPGPLSSRIHHILNRMDLVGLLIFAFGFGLLLVPFSLAAGAEGGYKNPSLIAMFVVGGLLLALFPVYEWRFAQFPIMPRRLLNRNFSLSVAILTIYYLGFYITSTYWLSFVYVVVDWSDRDYAFFSNIGTVALTVAGVLAGGIMWYTRNYKWLQFSGICIRIIGCGLYYVCSSQPSDAVLVLSGLLDVSGGAFIMQGLTVASQGSVPHQDLAIAIAIQILWSTTAGAIGSAIASSIWTHHLPLRLAANLSGILDQESIDAVYGSIVVARMTEPRDLVIKSYLETSTKLFLPTLVLSFAPLLFHFFMQDYKLDDRHNMVEDETIHVGGVPPLHSSDPANGRQHPPHHNQRQWTFNRLDLSLLKPNKDKAAPSLR